MTHFITFSSNSNEVSQDAEVLMTRIISLLSCNKVSQDARVLMNDEGVVIAIFYTPGNQLTNISNMNKSISIIFLLIFYVV